MFPTEVGDDAVPDPREASGPIARLERALAYALLDLDGPDRQIGRYTVRGLLGKGGMGVVARAHDPQLDREVALKLLDSAHGDALAEARALAQLSHPNIVGVYEVGEVEGAPYIAMELVEGTTLREWLAQPRTRSEILRTFLDIGDGLRAAHEQRIVHRDFKPENVLVGADNRPRVADFGLARPTEGIDGVEAPAGTPAYMAPEQWHGRPADERSDQFAFCVSLFEALYGARPFSADTAHDLMEQVTHGAPRMIPARERAPGKVHDALLRGLSREPADRWPVLADLLDTIRETLDQMLPGLHHGSPGPVFRIMLPTAVTLPLGWLILELTGVVPWDPRPWVYVTGLQLLLMASVVYVARDKILPHFRTPRVMIMPAIFVPLFLAHRLLALATGSSVELMFAYDYLVLAAVGWGASLLVQRSLILMSFGGLTLTVLSVLWPFLAPRLWVAFVLMAPIVALYAARHQD